MLLKLFDASVAHYEFLQRFRTRNNQKRWEVLCFFKPFCRRAARIGPYVTICASTFRLSWLKREITMDLRSSLSRR